MWIVRLALTRPLTFIVLALLLPLLGALTIFGTPLRPGMPTDIFPEIRIPVIAVVFNYTGLPPDVPVRCFTVTTSTPFVAYS